jgi:hypothetical protein
MRVAILAIVAWAVLAASLAAKAAEPFSFIAIGDMPYGTTADYKPFERLIARINARKPAFTIHVGDIKSGSAKCSDAVFRKVHDYFMTFDAPLFYTPGDNEWTDCHRKKAGDYKPLERLAAIRAMFFAKPQSLGKRPLPYARQSDGGEHKLMVENARWSHQGVLFATVHVVGSNNGFGRKKKSNKEFKARDEANRDWIAQTFAQAQADGAAAVVLSLHANPLFELAGKVDALNIGFAKTLRELTKGAKAFGMPVLVIHGDFHTFMIDQPLWDEDGRQVQNLTCLEVFGASDVHGVEVTVDADDPGVFGYRPLIVKGNL